MSHSRNSGRRFLYGSPSPRRRHWRLASPGQSLVEFSLVLPLLMVLLLGVVDFGRVFAAGITMEAAARNGAEAVALERLHNPPSTPGDPAYYQALHNLAASTVCHEARSLPSTTYDAGPPESCPDMPIVAVCVHDGADPLCTEPDAISGNGGGVPPQCSQILDNTNRTNDFAGDTSSKFVEVRTCYRFTTLFNLHLQLPMSAGMDLGDVWLQRTRTFVIDCPPLGTGTC
jgi:TadE-like protein